VTARSYRAAREGFSWKALWDLVDGDARRLNLAHECVDRHVGRGAALRLQFADGHREEHTFDALAAWSARFAHFLEREGLERGDRVAIMLEPSLAFYGTLFGTVKRGAIAVPLFTLFGPDGVSLRLDDCRPRMLVVERDAAAWRDRFPHVRVLAADADLTERLDREPPHYAASSRSSSTRRAPRARCRRRSGTPTARWSR
jgi:acetyl-CoA synthetase